MAKRSVIAELVAAFGRLNGRERLLVGITVLAAVLFGFFGGTIYVRSRLQASERGMRERRGKLEQIVSLEQEYKDAESSRQRAQNKLAGNDVQLFSFLPPIAKELGLTLNDLNERRTPLKDSGIDEISVDVNLRQVSVDKLDAFLEKVEGPGSKGLVKILKLKVKTRFDNAELLDVTMKVATYKKSSAS